MKLTVFLTISLVAMLCIMGGLADVARVRYDNDRDARPSSNIGGGGGNYGGRGNDYDRNSGGSDRRPGTETGRFEGRGESGGNYLRPQPPPPPPPKISDVCTCTRIWLPVCGSDGVTYPNICQLNCKKNEGHGNNNIRVACNRACPCSSYSAQSY